MTFSFPVRSRQRGSTLFLAGLVLLAAGLLPRAALALTACTAADVIRQDPACPAAGACTIDKAFSIGDGCTLDFGTRNVTLAARGDLDIASGSVTLLAGNLVLSPGAVITGRGTGSTAPTNHGGMLMITTTGTVMIQKSGTPTGAIDVSGNGQAGIIIIQTGGSVTLAGALNADNLTIAGGGGTISIRSGGDFQSALGSTLSASGGKQNAGGEIDINAAGRVLFGDAIDLPGGDGGVLDVQAGQDVVVQNVDVSANGDAGGGGCVGIVGGTSVQLLGQINVNGNGSSIGSGGGCGGFGCFESRFGDLTVAGVIVAEGAVPDGGGGDFAFIARRSILVQPAATVSVRSNGDMGCGGSISADATFDTLIDGPLDASGGFGGGFIDMTAGRDMRLGARVDSSATAVAGFAGEVTAEAGLTTKGNLLVTNTVDVSGGGCSSIFGCGLGGSADLSGCDVTLTSTGSITTRGPDAGPTTLTAREQLTVQGSLDATTTAPTNVPAGMNGSHTFTFPSRKTPVINGSSITPGPVTKPMPTCTAAGQAGCLIPCPTCGNGTQEFPETCDDGNTLSCDGCSVFCQTENPSCNDANACTSDSCDAGLGCRQTPVADGTPCLDGNICNGNEKCGGGICLPGRPLNCSDGNPCTTDHCDPVGGCQPPTPSPPGTPCSDANQCTVGDTCDAAGNCQSGVPRICNDGRECTTDTCNPVSGCIFTPRTGASCTDDGNPCTNDVCAGVNCTHPTLPDTTACNQGAFCTSNASCHAGVCQGTPHDCDDGNPCTTDSCDEPDRTCLHIPLAACSTTTTVTTTTSSTASTAPTTSSTSTSTSTTRSTSSTAPPTTSSSSTSTSTTSSTHTTTSTSSSTSSSTSTTHSTSTTSSSTSTSTSTSSTSTSTAPPNPCVPANCDDANPCTADTCAADGCHHAQVTGFEAAQCVFLGAGLQTPVCQGQAMPTTITQLFGSAKSLIDLGAQNAASPKKAKGFVRKAAKALKKDGKLVARAAKKRTISADCAAALTNLLSDATTRTKQLLSTL